MIDLTYGDNSERLAIDGDVAYIIDSQKKLNEVWRQQQKDGNQDIPLRRQKPINQS